MNKRNRKLVLGLVKELNELLSHKFYDGDKTGLITFKIASLIQFPTQKKNGYPIPYPELEAGILNMQNYLPGWAFLRAVTAIIGETTENTDAALIPGFWDRGVGE